LGIVESIILGIVEGITEFLPVSSTGHLILASHIMGIQQTTTHKTFEVAIAVVFLYRKRLFQDINLWKKLIIAFIPTGILGFALYKIIKSLFSPYVVAFMLISKGIFHWNIPVSGNDSRHIKIRSNNHRRIITRF